MYTPNLRIFGQIKSLHVSFPGRLDTSLDILSSHKNATSSGTTTTTTTNPQQSGDEIVHCNSNLKIERIVPTLTGTFLKCLGRIGVIVARPWDCVEQHEYVIQPAVVVILHFYPRALPKPCLSYPIPAAGVPDWGRMLSTCLGRSGEFVGVWVLLAPKRGTRYIIIILPFTFIWASELSTNSVSPFPNWHASHSLE